MVRYRARVEDDDVDEVAAIQIGRGRPLILIDQEAFALFYAAARSS